MELYFSLDVVGFISPRPPVSYPIIIINYGILSGELTVPRPTSRPSVTESDRNRAMTSANSARVCPITIDIGSLHLLPISCRSTESYFSDYSRRSLFRNFAIVLGFWNVGPSQGKRTPIVWPCGRIVAATQCLEGQNVLNLIYYKYRVVLTMLITELTSSSSCDLSSILGTTNLKLLDEFRRIHNCCPKSYLEGVTLRSNFPAGI